MSRADRLKHLVASYPEDFKAANDKYKRLCECAKIQPKSFLTDETLLPEGFISVSLVVDAIVAETSKIVESHEELREEAEKEAVQERAAKRAKAREDNPQHAALGDCVCGGSQWLGLYGRGKDCNYWTLPSGREGEGYMPDFGLPNYDSDGVLIDVCMDCGRIRGFNSARVKAAVEQLELRADERGA